MNSSEQIILLVKIEVKFVMMGAEIMCNKDLRKCYYKRIKYVENMEGSKKESCDYEHFVEFSNQGDYLADYFLLEPCPFQKETQSTVFKFKSAPLGTCVVKTRGNLCQKCLYRAGCADKPLKERCSEQEMESFATGHVVDVQLNQQTRRSVGDQKATLEPLMLHDVRLSGRPGRLEVKRHGWNVEGTSKRRPVEVIPHITANKKETMVLRLMHAVNETYVAYGNKNAYIAEGYGISKDLVSKHITSSAKLIREKYSANKEKRDLESIRSRLFGTEDLRPNITVAKEIEITFSAKSREWIAIFEVSADDGKKLLIDIYPKREEVEPLRRQLQQKLIRDDQEDYLVTTEYTKSMLYMARCDYRMRTPSCGIPPELSYLIILLWKEVLVQLDAIQYEMGSEIADVYREYLTAVFDEIIEKINVSKEEISLEELRVFERRFDWPSLREDELVGRLFSCFQVCLMEWMDYIHHASNPGEALEKWESNYAVQATDDQLLEIGQFVEVFQEKVQECDEDTSLQDIFNAIWMNQVTVPITGMPDGGFDQSAVGWVDIERVDGDGIPLRCLKHLLEEGLLSEDPRHRPVCGLYEDQIWRDDNHDLHPCRECMRREVLRMEAGEDTNH